MKKKILIFTLISAFLTFCFVFASCQFVAKKADVEQETYAITWKIDQHASVSAQGFDTLPTTATNGDTIKFTVTCSSGYEIDSVENGGRAIYAQKGVYSFTVRGKTTITVQTVRAVESIEVTELPELLTYYAGDTLNLEGMVVQANYATGETEVITDYRVSISEFEGGETSFIVFYGNKQAEVELAQTVEYKVQIDPNGGVIAEEALAAFQAQHNFYVDEETGVISFTYFENIEGELLLPTAETITKENNAFISWPNNTTAIRNTSGNVNIAAIWDPELVRLSAIYLEVEEDVPYLVLEGTFIYADEAYLYLYEGNVDLSLVGPTFTRNAEDDNFSVRFDLRELSDLGQEYWGKWMDIRFNASMNDGEKEESQQIYLPIEVDTNSFIRCNGYNYTFVPWTNPDDGTTTLKVRFNDVDPRMSYTLDISEEEGVPTLIVAGQLDAELTAAAKNGTITIQSLDSNDWSQQLYDGTIGEDGSFNVKVDLSNITIGKIAYVHVEVKDASNTTVYGSTSSTNLHPYGSTTPLEKVTDAGSLKNAIHEAFNGIVYYVGYEDGGEGGGIVLYAVDMRLVINELELKVENDTPYIVLKGTTSLTTADFANGETPEEDGIAAKFGIDFENTSSWTRSYPERVDVSIDTYGKIQITFDLSEVQTGTNTMHISDVSAANYGDILLPVSSEITVNGYKYTLTFADLMGWGNRDFLIVAVAE